MHQVLTGEESEMETTTNTVVYEVEEKDEENSVDDKSTKTQEFVKRGEVFVAELSEFLIELKEEQKKREKEISLFFEWLSGQMECNEMWQQKMIQFYQIFNSNDKNPIGVLGPENTLFLREPLVQKQTKCYKRKRIEAQDHKIEQAFSVDSDENESKQPHSKNSTDEEEEESVREDEEEDQVSNVEQEENDFSIEEHVMDDQNIISEHFRQQQELINENEQVEDDSKMSTFQNSTLISTKVAEKLYREWKKSQPWKSLKHPKNTYYSTQLYPKLWAQHLKFRRQYKREIYERRNWLNLSRDSVEFRNREYRQQKYLKAVSQLDQQFCLLFGEEKLANVVDHQREYFGWAETSKTFLSF